MKLFHVVTAIIFLFVGVFHGIRAYKGWILSTGVFDVPLWVSWLAAFVLLYLAYASIKLLR